jgi:DNA-binding MarR family transcriptional regulator
MTLRRAARRISQRYDEALAPAGLRVAQFSILATLHARERWSVHELADKLELERTTMGKNLRPLERDGLVRMAVDEEDRRGRQITLTPDGLRRLEAATELWAAAQRAFEEANGKRKVRELRDELAGLRA